ncbi:hypothetical protein OCD79_05060 [Bacillus wiedmannii]|nr:hypothetical protein [Bacillus wiedmannii]MCU5150615.1 hypothetical protein [Bacillus wiedmannii]MCU5410970.1 hypothetical protein [Bacillus wiedmannii]MED3613846.1 hypothetical protein [Bacillus wiedmannii]
MFARAFEVYIAPALLEQEPKNDF